MSNTQQTSRLPEQLPPAIIDRLSNPLSRFLRIEAAAGIVLLLFTVLALILSNSAWADWYEQFWEIALGVKVASLEFSRSLREWINDGLMTMFFFLVALELKRELILGELRNPRMAALSIAGALGGMLMPAALYLSLQWGQPGQSGWGTVMATDTAFVVGCLALLGARVPHGLRVFMLSLAIVDDIGAILVVAISYSHQIVWEALAFGALGIIAVRVMALMGIRGFPAYFLIGAAIWLAIDASGIHATITGVILGLMTPARRWVSDTRLYGILQQVVAHPASDLGSGDTENRRSLQVAEIAARETLSPIERLVYGLHPWVSFIILPLFAFANAGLSLSAASELPHTVAMAVFVGFAVGKPTGILLFSWLAVRLGVAVRPAALGWRWIIGGGFLAGIGFTMALFIASLAFAPALINSVKLGIFSASLFSALAGLAWLKWVAVTEPHAPTKPTP